MRWGRNVADAELADLRRQLSDVLKEIDCASAKAQIAVQGSSNDPDTLSAHREAVEIATRCCQNVASIFRFHDVGCSSPELRAARREFREAVTEEDNPSVMDRNLRTSRCEAIERATAVFHAEVTDEAFRRWGQGVGSKSGKLEGRKVPK